MRSYRPKTGVRRQDGEITPDTEPGEESIDRSGLNVGAAAVVAQLRSFDVIIAIGHQDREGRKVV